MIAFLIALAWAAVAFAVAVFVGHAMRAYATEQEQYRDIEKRHSARFNHSPTDPERFP
jgi:hypothetical protein